MYLALTSTERQNKIDSIISAMTDNILDRDMNSVEYAITLSELANSDDLYTYDKVEYVREYEISNRANQYYTAIELYLSEQNPLEFEDLDKLLVIREVTKVLLSGTDHQQDVVIAWLLNQCPFISSSNYLLTNEINIPVVIKNDAHTHSTVDVFHGTKRLDVKLDEIDERLTLLEENGTGGSGESNLYLINGGNANNERFHPSVR